MADATTTQNPPVTDPKTQPKIDPWTERLLGDLGKVIKDGNVENVEPTHDVKPQNLNEGFTTLAEVARANAEKKKAEEGKTEGDKKEEKKEEPKTDDKAQTSPEAEKKDETKTDEKKAEEKPAKKKIEVERVKPIEEIVEGVVKRVMPQVQPEKKAEQPKVEKKEDKPAEDPFISTLDDEQKESIELAKFAAQKNPDRYGNMPNQLVEYYKKVESYIDKKQKEDAEWNPEEDEEFAEWVESNRPDYHGADRKRLERQMIEDSVKAEVRKDIESEFKPKIEEAERLSKAHALKPELDNAVKSYRETTLSVLAPDEKSPFHEIVKTVTEGQQTKEAWEKAEGIDPIAASIIKPNLDTAAALAEEYLGLRTRVLSQVPYNEKLAPDSDQNVHAARQFALFKFIERQEAIFNTQADASLKVKEGKMFVPRRDFAAMPPEQQAKHWTVTDADVLDMLSIEYTNRAKSAYDAEIKRLERAGYKRQTAAETTKKEETAKTEKTTADKAGESPKARSSSSPGAASGSTTQSTNSLFTKEELEKSWAGGAAIAKG